VTHDEITCDFCHSAELEIVRNPSYGFIVVCGECGYARGATLQHLMVS